MHRGAAWCRACPTLPLGSATPPAAALVVPGHGSRASSERTWRLWLAWHSQGKRPGHWASSHCLGCSSEPRPLLPVPPSRKPPGTPLDKEDRAWRYCYFLPVALCLAAGCAALTGRDLPDGDIKQLEKTGAKQKPQGRIVLRTGLCNVNAWVLTITYGMCFGVELTMNSVAFLYFHDYHGLAPHEAGLYASLYGLMNLFARSLGGQLSDWSNERFGMRGRIWACWIVMSLEGVFCMLMASVTLSMDAPFNRQMTQGWTRLDAGTCGRYHKRHENRYHENRYHERHDAWCPVNDTQVSECGCVHQALSPMYQQMYDVGDKVSKHDVRAFLLPASCLLLTAYYLLTLTY
mmetsp:Transcript_46928/g.112456  ORF Transcript_46928/g.112456 Transcript_46928/m.112456 type:complete len:347 (-) Transcript_46928:773-1813(-)